MIQLKFCMPSLLACSSNGSRAIFLDQISMDVVTGAMSTLLPKLGNLLEGEYKLQSSVRDGIKSLKAELEAMEAALLQISEAPMDQPPNALVKLWARDVREVSYDVEDHIDTSLVRLDHAPEQLHGLKGFLDRIHNLLTRAKIRHEIGIDINKIKTSIREVSERRDRYKQFDNITAKPTCPSVETLRLSAIYKNDATDFVGTKDKSNDLEKLLMDEDEASKKQLKIISIVGFGGLGKTTLAHVVYMKLKEKFECGAFVSVSRTPNMGKIFRNMLHQLDMERYEKIDAGMLDETQLIKELRDLLRTKRYFIVIDDIWTTSVWANIMYALIKNELGSRIITTTRILNVAEQAGGLYELKPLSPVDSRKLFYHIIFGTEDMSPPNELASVSENILRKCGGVPLAIITIGSMLASKKETHEYWSKVYRSMGSGLKDTSDGVKDMRRILSVSYYDLHRHLRTCLLYLSMYPEDYEISTTDLMWKWIGEGFLKEHGEDMFKVGEEYIYELINRSLIQPSYIDDERKTISRIQIHDMVLDLITFLSNEDHFVTKLGAQQQPNPLPDKIRRLSLQTSNGEDVKKVETMRFSHVRSLIVFSGSSNLFPAPLPRFPVLRVLDLGHDVQVGNHHFKYICNMFHLRYLALRSNGITEIPKDIGNLKFLQVLLIHGTKTVELPSSFVQLQQLVYLQFENYTLVTVPDRFGYLKCLQELIGNINLMSPNTFHVLGGLTMLRRVSLFISKKWDQSYEKPFLSWLSSMVSLKYLSIEGGDNIDLGSRCDKLSPEPQQLQEINIYCAVCSVPRWISSLCSLSILRICLLTLSEEDLEILGSIPSLSHLAITMKEPTKSRDKELLVIGNAYPFLSLKKFEIYENMEVMFVQGAMPKLQSLKLYLRETMVQFGDSGFGLENLSSLEHVSIVMILCQAKPREVEEAITGLQKAVDMNPNKPGMKLTKLCHLKLNNIHTEEQSRHVVKSIKVLYGIDSISINWRMNTLTVCGMVDPTTLIDKLEKDGIQAEPSECIMTLSHEI